MARPIRNTSPARNSLVTIRTERAELLMRPDEGINEVLGGILAKYQELFGIIIYAYTFLSNHYHLLLQAPHGNLWKFCQGVNREIAKRTNSLRQRKGHFWRRRYDEQAVLEAQDLLHALLYVVANPTSHGLVDHPKNWPGIHSFAQLLDGKDRQYTFTNYTAYRKALLKARHTGKSVSIEDFQSKHTLTLTPLPQFQHLTGEERRQFLHPLIENRVIELRKERLSQGKSFLGRRNVLKQTPFSLPQTIKNSPRPLCYTKSFEAKKVFMAWYFPWLAAYREASKRFRAGDFSIQFPLFSIRPPLLYCP